MQRLIRLWNLLFDRLLDADGYIDRHEAVKNRREFRLGLLGACFVAVVLLVTAAIYVLPLGKSTYTADLPEAQSLKVGDQVRVAGITVGSVTALDLRPDRVRTRFTVKSDVSIGDATTLEVRMLTAIGGHYLAVLPAGSKPLGSKIIPPDRVKLPYSLVRTLQDAAAPVAQVDGDTLRKNLAALQDSLDNSPDALRRVGRAMQSFVDILNHQNAEVSQALTVAREFLGTVEDSKGLIGQFVRQTGMLEIEGLNKRAEITVALNVTAQLLSRIAALEPTSREVLEPLAEKLRETLPQLKELGAQLDIALPQWKELRDRLVAATAGKDGVTVDQSALNVCIPVPGRGC
ncbi:MULTISPECIES: MlaD family protein [unclassified Nocardia]|uniref:MlaD family protein n=1 Tax=unclassified Nocardia TaxID=2637762 RepID=UPI001CE467E2|nr:MULTISPECIES: MlaD family protein [unclassified Nocardia]